MTDSDTPRPGSARINGGPWMRCRFTLNGALDYVEWDVDAEVPEDYPVLGPAAVEIAICPGVSVFGDVIITDLYVRDYGASFTAIGSGGLRGARG